jgi:putative ABC transport system permease protein
MIKNYFKIAFRNLLRHKAYSFINISGLAIGMACSILILLWVQNELSYDRFHANARQLYRITAEASGFKAAVNPPGMPGGLKQAIPGIKSYVRISTPQTLLFQSGEQKFEENKVFYADSNFLELFSFPLVKGDRNTALHRVDGVLITQSTAKKYFGKKEPMGKILRVNNNSNVMVTGVLADVPANSHLQFDFIMPIAAIAQSNEDLRTNTWENFDYYNYLLLERYL